jgi:hypothetical protein
MINFKCSCGKELKVPDSFANKVVTCNQCSRRNIKLPEAGKTLDLTEFELEDINAGTIVLEPPSTLSSISPRKAAKNQPKPVAEERPRRPVKKAEPAPVPEAIPRRQAKKVEPEPEPQVEFEAEPARPARATRRLESRKPEPVAEKPARNSTKRTERKESQEKSTLKARSSQITLKTNSKRVAERENDDEQETVSEVPAARGSRSGRGEKDSRRGSENQRGKNSRSRDNSPEPVIRDYGNSQKFLYLIIGLVILLGVGLFFFLREPEQKKPTSTPVAEMDQVNANVKPTPKVAEPAYEKITEAGNELIALYDLKGPNKDSLVKALEDKRLSSVKSKLSSKSYDQYIQEVLKKKLWFVLAIENILDTQKIENEDQKFVLYTLESKVDATSNINEDKDYMKDFILAFTASKISWDKEKLTAFLETKKTEFANPLKTVELVKARLEWSMVVDIVINGKVENDTFDSPFNPQ